MMQDSFIGLFLHVLILALVTVFLLLVCMASCMSDNAYAAAVRALMTAKFNLANSIKNCSTVTLTGISPQAVQAQQGILEHIRVLPQDTRLSRYMYKPRQVLRA